MRKNSRKAMFGLAIALSAAAGSAHAAEVLVGDPAPGAQAADLISVSTTWTADNTYNLRDQIFVMPGATLTIEAGTVVASTPSANGSGSLAVTRGAKIFVLGTKDKPVIMTSTNDVATWTAGDPKTGTWREAANEWGNLTILGEGLISGSHFGGAPITINDNGNIRQNTKLPDGMNRKQMEGLIAGFVGDPKVLYGGANDNDDSGTICYLSLRYTGRVVGLGNELNGLSLGGVGRETDISHVEIMNNVDDGVEIWGGTVHLKYISIWNIGDDSFDIDQGWRGKAQFIFVVQGYSVDAVQGSGVGDNGFEMDGAEDSDAQPVTTGVIANATFIGQPVDGDHATAWRDNARVQFYNSIFMDTGERFVGLDNVDGDGAQGYGFNGTLSWVNTWTTPYTTTSLVNAINPVPAMGAFNHPAVLYQAQTQGNLISITDSVTYNNNHASAYTEADARNVFASANNNIRQAASSPISAITRAAPALKGGKVMVRVTSIDPRPANDALMSVASPPNDGWFTQVLYRGAFSKDNNWARGWTASDAFGFYSGPANASEPPVAMKLHTTTVSFETTNGVTYTIECGSVRDDVTKVVWTPIKTLIGTGGPVTVADVLGEDFDAAKLYRVRVQ